MTSASHPPEARLPDEIARREPPTEWRWADVMHVSLPRSPPPWEVDGRRELDLVCKDDVTGPVMSAHYMKRPTRVVKLGAALAPEQRSDRWIGDAIAKSYRALVRARIADGNIRGAATHYAEMFARVPEQVTIDDKLHFNRLLEELDRRGQAHRFTPLAGVEEPPLFTVSTDSTLRLDPPRALEGAPDRSYRVLFAGSEGSWLVARRWSRPDSGKPPAALIRLDRSGSIVAEKSLDHDVYVAGAGGASQKLAVMDSDGVLRIYDDRLNVVFERRLGDDPRLREHFRTIDTHYSGELKSQVRIVDVSPEGDRYLFTIADEAWCCTIDGGTLWGVSMPLVDGWKRVIVRRRREPPDDGDLYDDEPEEDEDEEAEQIEPAEIEPSRGPRWLFDDAPKGAGGALEVEDESADDGEEHEEEERGDEEHEDEELEDEEAEDGKPAASMVDGIAPPSPLAPTDDVLSRRFVEEPPKFGFARTGPDKILEGPHGVRLAVTLPRQGPQDWVYGGTFTALDGGVYLATYSGKVLLLSKDGEPVRVFEVGMIPDEIIEQGRYLYLLTRTRLYVIEDRQKLVAFLDVFQQGRLRVMTGGFALIADKRVSWFTLSGTKLGELHSREPIRTLHEAEGGAIVRTASDEVLVRGLVR